MNAEPKRLVNFAEFTTAVKQLERFGEEFEIGIGRAFDPTTPWFTYLFGKKSHVTDLEHMIQSAQREVVILGTLGLFQPGVLALRSFFELVHSWPYYAEHPREWLGVKQDTVFFETPGRSERAMTRLIPGISERMTILRSSTGVHDTYGKLSRYAHSSDSRARALVRSAADLVR